MGDWGQKEWVGIKGKQLSSPFSPCICALQDLGVVLVGVLLFFTELLTILHNINMGHAFVF